MLAHCLQRCGSSSIRQTRISSFFDDGTEDGAHPRGQGLATLIKADNAHSLRGRAPRHLLLRQLIEQSFHLFDDFGVRRIVCQVLQFVRVLLTIKQHRDAVIPFGVTPAFGADSLPMLLPNFVTV